MYRMVIYRWFVGDEICICLIAKRGVAISGCPGFEDLQDVVGLFLVGSWFFLGCF